MTRDEIIRMAREAGFSQPWTAPKETQERLARFFNAAYEAGAAAEREECAKLCERAIDENVKLMPPNYWGLGYNSALVNRAVAIRARGEK